MSRRSSYVPYGGRDRSFDWNDTPQPSSTRPQASTHVPMTRRESIGSPSTSDWPLPLSSSRRQDSSYWRRNSGIPTGSGLPHDESLSRLESTLLNSGPPELGTRRFQTRPRVDDGIPSRSTARDSYGASADSRPDPSQFRRPFAMRDSFDNGPSSRPAPPRNSYDWDSDFLGQGSPPRDRTPRPGRYDGPYAGAACETTSSGGWGSRSIAPQATSGVWGDRNIASRPSSPSFFGPDGRSLPAPGRRPAQAHIPVWDRGNGRPSSSYYPRGPAGLDERDMRFQRR